MSKIRGFEPVRQEFIQNFSSVITEDTPIKFAEGVWIGEVQLPVRADTRSAGYDFFMPRDLLLLPAQKQLVFSDVKAYMQDDEYLELVPRSSLGIKQGMMMSNTVGVIDSSYYENESNDGNIGLALLNTSGRAIELKKGDRVAQGIFKKYLIADDDKPTSDTRTGGIGSSGK